MVVGGVVLLVLSLLSFVSLEPLGCGGFISPSKSLEKIAQNQAIDYSTLFKVGLYTSEGILKEASDVAPNGYYFLPIYDKGTFKLKVQGPQGWSFNPKEVPLSFQEDSASGEIDVNFEITGFTVSGKVSEKLGDKLNKGPQGITVTLKSDGADVAPMTTTTSQGGQFEFTEVIPGRWLVSVSHPSWSFSSSETKFEFSWDNHYTPDSSLVLSGYDVKGRVETDGGEPVKGVQFFLYGKAVKTIDCPPVTMPTPLPRALENRGKALCSAVSDASGQFSFKNIPSTSFTLVPFHKDNYTTFDVMPKESEFEVNSNSYEVSTPFQIKGFSLRGRVISGDGKTGMKEVAILVDGKSKTVTDDEGYYRLEQMTSGTYQIEAQYDHTFFSSLTDIKLVPEKQLLPDIYVSKLHLCGSITISVTPSGVPLSKERKVSLTTKDNKVQTTSTSNSGKYCFEVPPGVYKVKPVVSTEEANAGLLLSPREAEIIIKNEPALEVNFFQSRVTISGTVKCIESPCHPSIAVTLSAVGGAGRITTGLALGAGISRETEAAFVFRDVLPGTYNISINKDAWCWEESSFIYEVEGEDVKNVKFVQSGYLTTLHSSHKLTLEIQNKAHPGKFPSAATQITSANGKLIPFSAPSRVELPAESTSVCLSSPGVYEVIPHSCYQFSTPKYVYSTSAPKDLDFQVTHYLINGSIEAHLKESDKFKDDESGMRIHAQAVREVEGEKVLGEKKNVKTEQLSKKWETVEVEGVKEKRLVIMYRFSYWAEFGEEITFTPSSDVLRFYPERKTISVNHRVCPPALPPFTARPGLFLHGKAEPELPGIRIHIRRQGTSEDILVTETRQDGSYSAGPLYDDQEYDVVAEKDGYQFALDRSKEKINFRGTKLGTIRLIVTDEKTGQYLPGVLATLTGGPNYKNNSLTQADGAHVFQNLAPGQYFLFVQLKEYVFDPPRQNLRVSQGTEETCQFQGKRVAFSCYGNVRSLNGDPEKFVGVEARAITMENGKPAESGKAGYLEETQTDADGRYRLRGLLPGWTYAISIKNQPDRIERFTPPSSQVVISGKDVSVADFIVFRKVNKFDMTGVVNVADLTVGAHYSSSSSPSSSSAAQNPAEPVSANQKANPSAILETLTLELYNQAALDNPIKVITFASPYSSFPTTTSTQAKTSPMILPTTTPPPIPASGYFELSSLSKDIKYVIRIKSSLPNQIYSFNSQDLVLDPTANSSTPSLTTQVKSGGHHVHVEIPFKVSVKASVAEGVAGSAPIMLLVGIFLLVCLFNYKSVGYFLNNLFVSLTTQKPISFSFSPSDDGDNDYIGVQSRRGRR